MPSRPILLACLWLPAAALAQCLPHTLTDWIDQAEATAMPLRPADCTTVQQNPPDFAWAHRKGNHQYTLHVDGPMGQRSALAAGNWHSWNETWPAGDYRWWLEAKEPSGNIVRSATRRFTLPAEAVAFPQENTTQLWQRAVSRARPRSLPQGAEWTALLDLLHGERASAFQALLKRVDGYAQEALPAEPALYPSKAVSKPQQVQLIQDMWRTMAAEETRIQESAFAAATTREPARIAAAVTRLMNIAAWNVNGASSHNEQFQVSRAITRSLATGYDWLYADLSASQRAKIRDVIVARLTPLANSVIDNGKRMEHNPRDSVGLTNLGVVASVTALMAGDLASVRWWFNQSVPLYANLFWPWGGEDGGYANGMNYAMWELADGLPVMDVLRHALALDLARKPYARNLARSLLYFVPPGASQGRFGDGAEQSMAHVYARYVKALAQRVGTEEARFHASLMLGEDASNLVILAGPALVPPARTTFPLDLHQPSTGWVAMHTDLKARDRSSVYFKASPFGSVSHSHADQNSITIDAGTTPLLVDSGYYDYYGSPHSKSWYRQTVAHNAVTFDGGQGQRPLDASAIGAIRYFWSDTDYAIAQGEAAPAYDGQVRTARRTVILLRASGRVLVHDYLDAQLPHSWELNLHAMDEMAWDGHQLTVSNGPARGCAAVWPSGLEFLQRQGYEQPPAMASYASQWHGVLRPPGTARSADFLMVMDVGCRAVPVPVVSRDEEGIQVLLDGGTIRLPRTGVPTVSLPPPPAKPTPLPTEHPGSTTPAPVPPGTLFLDFAG